MKGPIFSVNEMTGTGSKVNPPGLVTLYRFDLFKGVLDGSGKVVKIRSVGSAYVREGLKTYTVHLKGLLKDTFYLLQNTKPRTTDAEYVLLTREPSQQSGRKYFWNNVGEGRILDGVNHGLMHLTWDVFMADDLYMTLHPVNVTDLPEAREVTADAA